MKYYYWQCLKCGRRFKSIKDGGYVVHCVCGYERDLTENIITETTKEEYDESGKKEMDE